MDVSFGDLVSHANKVSINFEVALEIEQQEYMFVGEREEQDGRECGQI